MSNTRTVSIVVDGNANERFEFLKGLGVENATLEGNTIKGTVAENLAGPLRTVEGVQSVTIEGEDQKPQIPQEVPKENPNVPQLEPQPQPAPSKVDAPAPTGWSGVQNDQ